MGKGMVSKLHASIQPLIEQRNAGIHLAWHMKLASIHKSDGRHTARLERFQQTLGNAFCPIQIPVAVQLFTRHGQIVKRNCHFTFESVRSAITWVLLSGQGEKHRAGQQKQEDCFLHSTSDGPKRPWEEVTRVGIKT